MNLDDYGTRIMAFDKCGNCGLITLRVPYQLLVDMLKNCKKSLDRDELIRHLKYIRKSDNLKECLNREKIWDLLDGQE